MFWLGLLVGLVIGVGSAFLIPALVKKAEQKIDQL